MTSRPLSPKGPDAPAAKTPGSFGESPSSPPVSALHCTARMSANSAKASVIMAKNSALTRSEKAPITMATVAETAMPARKPRSTWP